MRFDAQNAAAAESGVQDFVAAGQCAGVRSGGLGGGFRPARLDDDDGLGAGHLARRGQERSRIADGLHVNENAASAGVVSEVVDEVAPADV